MPLRRRLLAGLLGATALRPAAACQAPHLGPGYCDADADLVADPPRAARDWLDPDPLVMGDVPTSDLSLRAARAEPFRLHLEQQLGRRVTYFVARDYADLLASFAARRVHLLNVNGGAVTQAVACHGFVPLAQPVNAQGEIAGYQMEIIVPANSRLRRIEDLRGHVLTLVDPGSASGNKTPRALLARQFGLQAERDYQVVYSGRQDNSVMGVVNGLYEAAAISSQARLDLEREQLMEPGSVRVLFSSPTLPLPPWGVSHRLRPELAQRIRQAMLSYAGPADALHSGSRFRTAHYRRDWAAVRALEPKGSPRCPPS